MSGLVDHGMPARQLCHGSNTQLMQDAAQSVECPSCLQSFSSFTTTRNGKQQCPVVPSHLPDREGMAKAELAALKHKSATPRPY